MPSSSASAAIFAGSRAQVRLSSATMISKCFSTHVVSSIYGVWPRSISLYCFFSSLRMSVVFRAEIQPRPAGSTVARSRAVVSIERRQKDATFATRAALPVAQQPEGDLLLALLAVSIVGVQIFQSVNPASLPFSRCCVVAGFGIRTPAAPVRGRFAATLHRSGLTSTRHGM